MEMLTERFQRNTTSPQHMRRMLLVFVAHLLLGLFMPAVWAGTAHPAAVPALPPDLLVDQTGSLNATERDALVQRLRAIQATGQGQPAIFISGDIGNEPLATYSLRVVEAWRLGRAGRDDGLLILVIPSTNAARLEVGYGLEGLIPDALASRWLDDLIPAMHQKALAAGLNRLLDEIDGALPGERPTEKSVQVSSIELLEAHPEGVLPFFLVVASPMTLIPLFLWRRGYLISGPLLALVLGMVSWALWDIRLALAVAGCAFPFPYLWSLNGMAMAEATEPLAPWQIYAKHFGNLIAVVTLFGISTLLLGFLLPGGAIYKWLALLFAGIFAILLATFLFPGKPARYLSNGIQGIMLFAFFAIVAYFALQPLMAQATTVALTISGTITAMLALTLYLDDAEKRRKATGQTGGIPWSLVLGILSVLAVVPFALLALVRAATGDDWQQQLIDVASGGGALTGVALFAARLGLLGALKVGLGGLFGGGGAGRG